jgi:hypothetical protein
MEKAGPRSRSLTQAGSTGDECRSWRWARILISGRPAASQARRAVIPATCLLWIPRYFMESGWAGGPGSKSPPVDADVRGLPRGPSDCSRRPSCPRRPEREAGARPRSSEGQYDRCAGYDGSVRFAGDRRTIYPDRHRRLARIRSNSSLDARHVSADPVWADLWARWRCSGRSRMWRASIRAGEASPLLAKGSFCRAIPCRWQSGIGDWPNAEAGRGFAAQVRTTRPTHGSPNARRLPRRQRG